jgi:hypothetical protein
MDVKFILVEIIWFVEIQQKQAILNANVTLHLAETADYVKLTKIPVTLAVIVWFITIKW